MLIAHSVLWLCSAIAERRPLALVIDDAQWADRSSLEVLSYLARRIDDLPLLIVVGARADDPDAASDLLSLLGGGASATVLHPQPLTARGAVQLIRALAPDTPVEVCRDCHRAVGGNPWLLGELGRQIAAHGPAALDDSEHDAPPVSAIARNVVRRRLAELTPRDRARRRGARGDRRRRAAARRRRRRRRRRSASSAPARDALVAAGLLGRAAAQRFAHGLIAAAIAEDLPRSERERLHREAARALMAAGADADAVASHLLECGPQADAERQRAAAARRRRRGAARRAAHRGGLPRARAERARAGRRSRPHARPARDGRVRRRACPTRAPPARGAAARRATARAASTC